MTLDLPEAQMIGTDVEVGVVFDNQATTAVGYGPYVDLFLDHTGADGDDGLGFVGAEYLGHPVESQTLTLACDGTDEHPLTGLPIPCPDGFGVGDHVVVLTLPFGSFSPDQPAIEITASLRISELADLAVDLPVAALGGFRYGQNPLDDPASDPPLVQAAPTVGHLTPTVLLLEKVDHAPESETATGENFRRTWTLSAQIAPGQTFTDLTLTDHLPPTVVFDGVDSLSAGGAATATPPTGTPHLPPASTLAATWPIVSDDVDMTFGFWAPRDDANGDPVLDPSSGAPVEVGNHASVTGTWQPVDPRDAATTITIDPAGFEDSVTARSLATQKQVRIVGDTGPTGASPGDVLEWTVQVQVSDYFSFDDVVLDDVMSDGQRLDDTFVPTLSLSTPSGSAMVADFADHFEHRTAACGDASPGALLWSADLSGALASALPSTAGRFVGGEGVGATTATIVLRSVIDSNYRCAAGATAVNSNDVISNDVTVSGAVVSEGVPTGAVVTDRSGDRVRIVAPQLTKSVYAINGDPAAVGPQVTPGDVVTYRLRAALPLTNTLNTRLTDNLPLPTFDIPVGGFTTDFAAPTPAGPFGATGWSILRGPDDTFTGSATVAGADPVVSVDQINNSLSLDYPDHQAAPGDSAVIIDLLVNVVAADTRFADGLFLTNQVELTYSDSRFVASDEAAIVQIELTEPRLAIAKGVVSTDRASGATFAPAQVGPAGVTWSPPGSAGNRFDGSPITAAGLAANPIGSDLSGVDAGDTVTFAIVVENTGSSANGAFDVTVTDALPPGFVEPAGGWNLRVTNGAGDPLPVTMTAGPGPLGAEITIEDEVGSGSLDAQSGTPGTNIAVFTFDATLAAGVEMGSTLTNTAAVSRYSGTEGGPNFVHSPIESSADVSVPAPDTAKVISSTELVPGASDVPSRTTLTIGSKVSYDVTMTVPEGAAAGVVLRDTLDAGLAVVSVDAITADPALSTSVVGGFAQVLADAQISSVGTGSAAAGRRVSFDFGTLVNSDDDNATAETIVVSLTAVVLNVPANTSTTNQARRNTSTVLIDGARAAPDRTSPAVTIVEPHLSTTKSGSVTAADAGDTVTYTLTVTAASEPRVSDAHGVQLRDELPGGVTLVPGSFIHTAGPVPSAMTDSGGVLTAAWPVLTPGQTATFTYQVTVDSDAVGHGAEAVNTATTTWSSQPGSPPSQSPHNPLGVERTGSPADPGGSANGYVSTDTVTVDVATATITKALTGTSAPHTTGADVTVGETVSYDLTVALPEGDLGQVVVTDLLPAGLSYVPGSAVVDTSALAGSLGAVSTTTAGNDVVVTFSTVTVDSTPSTADNTVVVSLQALVTDVPTNTGGAVLENRGRVTVAGTQVTSPPVPVTVVLPRLELDKSVDPTSAAVSDTVTYSFELTNTGTSPAFDVTVVDVVDTDLLQLGPVTAPAGWTASTTPVADGVEVTFSALPGTALAPGASVTFELDADLRSTISYPGSHVNTAEAVASSMPGSVPVEREVTTDGEATLTFIVPDISVTKTSDISVAEAGDEITYTIEVANVGDRDATGVSVIDTLGDHVTYVSATAGGVYSADDRQVTWPTMDLAAGAPAVSFEMTVRVVDPLPVGATSTVNSVSAPTTAPTALTPRRPTTPTPRA